MLHIGSRPWDAFDVYLFDIDGTLLHCTDATHYFAFCQALKMLSGRELTLEGVVAHGNTDTGILRDALTLAGVPEAQWRHRLTEAYTSMGEYVAAREQELCTTVLPGVYDVLTHLQTRGARLGVATGNLGHIGSLKLQRAGLLEFFTFAGWSDGFETRADVFRAAAGRAKNLFGDGTTMCVLGDTPADVTAAHQVGLPVIALATGIFSYEELMRELPEVCLHSLEELVSPAGRSQ